MTRRMDTRCRDVFDPWTVKADNRRGSSKLSDLGKTKCECHNAQLLYHAHYDTSPLLRRHHNLSCERKLDLAWETHN
jgi:hypothetical protein